MIRSRGRLKDPVEDLAGLLATRSAVVLSGAGCSTGSGIPDYRGPDGRLKTRMPMTYQEFVGSPGARARYWSRSVAGWPRIRDARPNRAHGALVRLEDAGAVRGVITQNVDGLHQAAGSRAVLELHGGLARVRCLECGERRDRDDFQDRLLRLNPGTPLSDAPLAPDGDAHRPGPVAASFQVPDCEGCGGVLKPDVVFFGENVPGDRLARAWEIYERSSLLLVAGSSLTVFSGRRFVLRARKEGKPVILVNLGATRCDEEASLKVEAPVEELLPRLVQAMDGPSGRARPPR